MFSFFGRLANENLHVTDLQFSTPDAFRSFADKLCSRADSGWQRVKLPVEVEGFPNLKARSVGGPPSFPERLHQQPPLIPGSHTRYPPPRPPPVPVGACSWSPWSWCTGTW